MRQTVAKFFGAKFVVKYWQAEHENRECCPQHGALNGNSAGYKKLSKHARHA
jgi:hypothetical protein